MKKKWKLIFFSVIILLPVLLGHSSFFTQNILFIIYIKAILSSSWNIAGGYAGLFDIGHSLYFGIAAYTVALLSCHYGISPWLGIFFGTILSLLISLTLGRLLLRLRLAFFALATLASLLVFNALVPYFRYWTFGRGGVTLQSNPGFRNIMFDSPGSYGFIAAILLILTIMLSYKIKNSKIGYYLLALRQDEDAANSLGVNTTLYRLRALNISALITGVTGGLMVVYTRQATPDFAFSVDRSAEMFLYSIVGGVGTVGGPLIGSFIFGSLGEYLRMKFGGVIIGLNYIIVGIMFVIVALKMPDGILSIINKIRKNKKNNSQLKVDSSPMAFNVSNSILPKTPQTFNGEDNPKEILSIENISKSFGGLQALKNINFIVNKKDILGIIGPNGAGKSTLFNVINGFIKPDFGTIKLEGELITNLSPHEVFRNGIGRTFQHLKPFSKFSTLENVMVGALLRTKDLMEANSISLQMLNMVGISSNRYDSKFSELSILERKKLMLGRVIAGTPKIILVDEIMAGLKPYEIEGFIALFRHLASEGVSVLVIEHRMKAIMELCERIVVLDHGEKLFEGLPGEVAVNEEVVNAYLGKDYEIVKVDNKVI